MPRPSAPVRVGAPRTGHAPRRPARAAHGPRFAIRTAAPPLTKT
ncbi:hypothetical protein BUH_5305 [Burkholderia pseudomallei Pakistan 9]|nr:hypothetical protein BUH_5305 [Burkholderia pseudomallei Pakistan 9]